MLQAKLSITVAAVLAGSGLLLQARTNQQEFKGQVTIGVHKVKLDANKLYEVVLDSPANSNLQLFTSDVPLLRTFSADFAPGKTYCMPNKAGEITIRVTPSFAFDGSAATFDYTLKFKAITLNDKPALAVDGQWAATDPLFKPHKNSHFKDYKIKVKAGQVQVIDLVKVGGNVDPYLYLEGPDGKIVAQDDDGGGFPNARIVYTPTKDGEYRIVATTLSQATGDFKLTVRQAD